MTLLVAATAVGLYGAGAAGAPRSRGSWSCWVRNCPRRIERRARPRRR